MTITHRIDDFLFELFPGTESDTEKLTDAIKRYYTIGPFEPSVDVDDNFIHITIDTERIETDKERFTRLVSLAENEKYDEAKELALELIEQAPNVSKYHRILGQIYSETGEQEEAMNTLIDALKWNPKNEWALLMMGNIYAKYKNDVETALTFYEQILSFKPDKRYILRSKKKLIPAAPSEWYFHQDEEESQESLSVLTHSFVFPFLNTFRYSFIFQKM